MSIFSPGNAGVVLGVVLGIVVVVVVKVQVGRPVW